MRVTKTLPVLLLSAVAMHGCDESPRESATTTELEPPTTTPSSAMPGTAPQSTSDRRQHLDDSEIAEAIRRELHYDPSIDRSHIDVEVRRGVVSLTGSVTHLLAKRRSAHVASAVKGVRAISNRLEVQAPRTADNVLEQAVAGALSVDPSTERFDVEATVKDQIVTLKGTVQSFAEKLWAERAVAGVSGVEAVRNALSVEYRNTRVDEEILEDVQARLRWDNVLNDGLVKASVDAGYVTLTGVVASLAEKQRAELNAWVAGVKGVDVRKLDVQWWAAEDDLARGKHAPQSQQDIQRAVERVLLIDPRVNALDMQVEIAGSVATLKGAVSTLAAKRVAEQLALDTVGVERVDNALEVDPGTHLDSNLELTVNNALKRDSIAGKATFHASVEDGVALLKGTVNNYAEKVRAEVMTNAVAGIRRVDNQLVVTEPAIFAVEVEDLASYPYVTPFEARVAPEPVKTDLAIKSAILREFVWSPYVDADDLEVTVDNGVAVLEGPIGSTRERSAAIINSYQGGAVRVDDRMILTSNP